MAKPKFAWADVALGAVVSLLVLLIFWMQWAEGLEGKLYDLRARLRAGAKTAENVVLVGIDDDGQVDRPSFLHHDTFAVNPISLVSRFPDEHRVSFFQVHHDRIRQVGLDMRRFHLGHLLERTLDGVRVNIVDIPIHDAACFLYHILRQYRVALHIQRIDVEHVVIAQLDHSGRGYGEQEQRYDLVPGDRDMRHLQDKGSAPDGGLALEPARLRLSRFDGGPARSHCQALPLEPLDGPPRFSGRDLSCSLDAIHQ